MELGLKGTICYNEKVCISSFYLLTHSTLCGGLNSMNIVISKPARTAAWVPMVTTHLRK